jgi:hypothetical protein
MVDGWTISLRDTQVECQTRDGQLVRDNLEILYRNYREAGIQGKAAADGAVTLSGFGMHLRANLGLFRKLPKIELVYVAPTSRLF